MAPLNLQGNLCQAAFLLQTSGLYYGAGFAVIGVTSSLLQGYQSYKAYSLLIEVNHHGKLA